MATTAHLLCGPYLCFLVATYLEASIRVVALGTLARADRRSGLLAKHPKSIPRCRRPRHRYLPIGGTIGIWNMLACREPRTSSAGIVLSPTNSWWSLAVHRAGFAMKSIVSGTNSGVLERRCWWPRPWFCLAGAVSTPGLFWVLFWRRQRVRCNARTNPARRGRCQGPLSWHWWEMLSEAQRLPTATARFNSSCPTAGMSSKRQMSEACVLRPPSK